MVAAGAISDLRSASPTRWLRVRWVNPLDEWQPIDGTVESFDGLRAVVRLHRNADVAADSPRRCRPASSPKWRWSHRRSMRSSPARWPEHQRCFGSSRPRHDQMIWTIAMREIVTRGRSKAFLGLTGVLFVGVMAVAGVQLFLASTNEAREVTIGVTGNGEAFVEALDIGNEDVDPTVEVVDDGEAQLGDGTIDVLFDGSTLTWEGLPDFALDGYVRDTVQQATFSQRAQRLGLSASDLGTLFVQVSIDEVRLDGGDDEFGVRFAAAGVAGLATFMLLQIWGSFLMMGVIEEKSSKVVEILLSHVRPSTLLTGKVLGLGILALIQMLIFAAGLGVGLILVQDISIPASVWTTVPLSVLTFLLGFAFYATAYAAVGSMVSRQEDATTAQLPVASR